MVKKFMSTGKLSGLKNGFAIKHDKQKHIVWRLCVHMFCGDFG